MVARPGRPEGPLDPESGAVAGFAAQLRRLREDAGRPSYRELARSAYYSHSALSQAAAGREFPSLAVTLAFVEACGGDRHEWTTRWRATACEAEETVPDATEPATSAVEPAVRTRRRRLTRVGISIGVVGGLVGLVLGLGWSTSHEPDTKGLTYDGADSLTGDCDQGSKPIAQTLLHTPDGQPVGEVELRYSLLCHAVWARYDPGRTPADARSVTIIVTVGRRTDDTTEVAHGEYNGQHVRSGVLLLPTGCAWATVTLSGPVTRAGGSATTCLPAAR